MTTTISPPPQWSRRRSEKQRRLEQVRNLADGVVLPSNRIVAALEALIAPGDRVVLEGNNQKQADFLSRSLARADPGRLHDLHMIMPSVSRAEHLDLFERGIARRLDFSFAGAAVAFAFGYTDAVSLTTIGTGAVTYIVGPVTGAALGAGSEVMALSIAAGLAATDPKLVPYGCLTAAFYTALGCLLGPSLLYFMMRGLFG